MAKHIIIIEGAAGSGKSTLIKRLVQEEWLAKESEELRAYLPRPRAYLTSDSGAGLSQAKDLVCLSEALWGTEGISLLDRGFLSQLVYHRLRTGDEMGFLGSIVWLEESIQRLIESLTLDYTLRTFAQNLKEDPRGIPRPSLRLLIYLPTLAEVLDRRAQSGKYYPYDAREELRLYRQAYLKLAGGPFCACITNYKEAVNQLKALQEISP